MDSLFTETAIVLTNISSKPTLCQPQTPLKESKPLLRDPPIHRNRHKIMMTKDSSAIQRPEELTMQSRGLFEVSDAIAVFGTWNQNIGNTLVWLASPAIAAAAGDCKA